MIQQHMLGEKDKKNLQKETINFICLTIYAFKSEQLIFHGQKIVMCIIAFLFWLSVTEPCQEKNKFNGNK
jgi:hypothetical protein